MKKLLLVLMLLAGVVTILSPPAASAQSEQVITVSLPGIWSDLIDQDAIIAEFQAAHPGTRVEVVNQDIAFGDAFDNAESSIEAAEALASAADVVYVDSSMLTTIGTRAGFFLDLSPLVNSDSTLDINDFYPAIWQSFQWDNAIWAVPVSADVMMINYDPTAFDEAGIPYPDGNWMLADYAQAARTLTEYDENGEVSLPGLSLGVIGSGNAAFARAITGRGFYDNSTSPETPDLDTPELQALLEEWVALEDEGVIATGFNERFMEIPISIGPQLFVAAGGPGGGPDGSDEMVATHLPGNLVGLEAQGFAVSSGTQYPELAYTLASFLTKNRSVAGNIFAATPARYSLGGVDPSIEGPGGFSINRSNSPEVQAVIDAGLVDGLPASELRYAQYILVALEEMRQGVDALTALQTAEAQAVADLQTADAARSDINVVVATPVPEVQLAAGEIELNTAISFAFGGGFVRIGGGEMPNQAAWDALNADFVASNPQVGNVSLELANVSSEAELTETYDCFITTSNLVPVPTADLSTFLNLDPFIDADASFDRNDVLSGVLSDLQQDNLTWGMPITITPDTLSYDAEMFQQAGLPLPTNGWTIDQFVDALEMLKTLTGDEAPYDPNDPGGAFILKLIAAYGGLPIDYRTSPPTINFTDPATVDAIRQVLDLAANGLIKYDDLDQQGFTVIVGEGEEPAPIMGTLNFGFGGPEGPFAPNNPETSYPSGSTYIPLSTQIVAGYISATAQNPEACYNWLREVAQHPTLFDGVPALRSAANNAEITSQLAPGTLDLMNQLEAVLGSPNIISFPGGPGGGIPFLSNWLYNAFDSYVLDGADLATALEDAQVITQAYLECASGIVRDNGDRLNPTLFEAYNNCATSVDPSFGQ